MSKKYYSLPLKASDFISNKEHKTCNINESIAHHIHLITTSYFGECTFDDTFGCSIWEIDFDNLKTTNKLRGLIKESLVDSLVRHERRLAKIQVKVSIKQEEIFIRKGDNIIKKRVDINVIGKVKKTNEDFSYVEYFYIGPLSY
ncbi:GPW/gp25 family protein [Cochleicola gelatinilyticus]|uniref:IraD/Gp25-like domain-containing protein n=1 Tax=Cochleicola gelatinilyticus TaxID=1763537 RepID=A0A167HLT6_9FLAO|nr:GPW/gp25 family protein [Cochleicola gelatinilyticus]OAB78749.1 hypothetical protein ULVI_09205 [Cochleicola gelatinilyticus]